MSCWGTFAPEPNADGEVVCPHCGAAQEMQDEPIDLDPEEFIDIGDALDEALNVDAPVALAPEPEAAAGSTVTADAPPPIPMGPPSPGTLDEPPIADVADEDFDAVIEIDLDEIEADEDYEDSGEFTEPLPDMKQAVAQMSDGAGLDAAAEEAEAFLRAKEPVDAPEPSEDDGSSDAAARDEATDSASDSGDPTEQVPDDGDPTGRPLEAAAKRWYLRSARGNAYVFLNKDDLVEWTSKLAQAPGQVMVSEEGGDWVSFDSLLPDGKRRERVVDKPVVDPRIGEIDLSDDALERSLYEEKASFAADRPEDHVSADLGDVASTGAAALGQGLGADATPVPEDDATARGVKDFTFKVDERDEPVLGRYAFMLLLGLLLGAGMVFTLAYLEILPPFPGV